MSVFTRKWDHQNRKGLGSYLYKMAQKSGEQSLWHFIFHFSKYLVDWGCISVFQWSSLFRLCIVDHSTLKSLLDRSNKRYRLNVCMLFIIKVLFYWRPILTSFVSRLMIRNIPATLTANIVLGLECLSYKFNKGPFNLVRAEWCVAWGSPPLLPISPLALSLFLTLKTSFSPFLLFSLIWALLFYELPLTSLWQHRPNLVVLLRFFFYCKCVCFLKTTDKVLTQNEFVLLLKYVKTSECFWGSEW